jgi:hypothetical protein
MRRSVSAIAGVLLVVLMLPMVTSAAPGSGGSAGSDVRELDRKARRELVVTAEARAAVQAANAVGPQAAPVVGEARVWLAIDDAEGTIYPKLYTLRGIGEHTEVWVASDEDDVSSGIDYPAGDCRNDGVRNVISDADVEYLINEFDTNMYPIESAAFSVPPERNGANAPLTGILDLPRGYYRGPGDRIVTLVDNVRDDNFYDTDNANSLPRIGGFYFSVFDDYFNRLVMNIDAYDWLHRTRANPPHDPSEDPCTNSAARPFLFEGTFAHEYQHLLMNYLDFDETSWVNEGLADYAQTITGYVDPRIPITQIGYDSHIQCFLGFLEVETPINPIPANGGPENSLTLWGDQTDYPSETFCDYGAAYTFMEYLADTYGHDLLTELHSDPANGLDSLAALLEAHGFTGNVTDVISAWAAVVAVDAFLDDGWTLNGGSVSDYSVPTLDAQIRWDNVEAYAGPGVPPNGSDYVRLRDATGAYLDVGEVDSIDFSGSSQLPRLPIEWRVDRNPPDGAGRALYSGQGDNLDRAIVRQVRVGQGNLVAELAWDTETDYDYAYVQVSDDGGETYRSVRCTDTVPVALGPGFEGSSDGFTTQHCNLRRYAGERVLLAFRYVTDGGVVFDGFWVGAVTLDGREVTNGRSLRGWRSPTQVNPVEVGGWVVRLVAYDEAGHVVRTGTLTLDESFDGSLSGADLDAIIGTAGSTVAAIVTHLDRSETVLQTAAYTLTVNEVEQPGG